MDARIKSGHDERICVGIADLDMPPPSRDGIPPGWCQDIVPPISEGAGNAGCLSAPAASHAKQKSVRA